MGATSMPVLNGRKIQTWIFSRNEIFSREPRRTSLSRERLATVRARHDGVRWITRCRLLGRIARF
jgi:hypothetical protein